MLLYLLNIEAPKADGSTEPEVIIPPCKEMPFFTGYAISFPVSPSVDKAIGEAINKDQLDEYNERMGKE